jgi:MazG family protein
VPRAGDVSLAEALVELQALTRQLRRDCPWDREQTARTIVPHTVEEAYEVADAANAGDPGKLLDELGDLLFQTYFLALLLEEQGEGDLEAIARAVHAKLVRRHPHVFGDAEADSPGRVRSQWELIKSEQEGRTGVFHDVPEALPGLIHARKVQRRAAAVGFDWPGLEGPLAKMREELAEIEFELARAGRPAPESEADPRVFDEVGDLLFTVERRARRERRSRARPPRDEPAFRHARRGGRATCRHSRADVVGARSRRPGGVVRRGEGATRCRPGSRLGRRLTTFFRER